MATFTSSLPDSLLGKLHDMATKLHVPKNKIIEKALEIYLDQMTRAEYIKSYKQAGEDLDILTMAEEGMEDYLNQLNP
ncbi:ribbon-helix-helix domain-containing protein [Bacteroidota bacterium]